METAPAASFAHLLRRFRVSAGLSQEALAERAGLSVRAISDLERGARRAPYRETIRLLAGALRLSPADQTALEQAVGRGRGPRALPQTTAEHAREPLPAAVTPLIGREREVDHLRTVLRQGDIRLLTLTGPPGIGKTRLALAVAAVATADRSGDIVFAGLAPIFDPGLVATSILQALGLAEVGGRPAAERLKDVLRDKRTLLVLDNFEQVVSAASLVGALLEACPELTVLVTSRVPLHLRGEHEFPVPPLSLPGGEGERRTGGEELFRSLPLSLSPSLPLESDAVRLFVERAQAVRPDFVLTVENAPAVVEICRHLDGLPLAIELAAARSKVLTPKAMLTRLEHRFELLTGGSRDAPARHRTLRAAIAWSHDLLNPEEQTLFRHLGVFVGGWTLEAADAVSRGGPEGTPGIEESSSTDSLLDSLSSLVDHSLVQQTETADGEFRFSMLETLREYALEQLDASGEHDLVRRRHASDVLALAEEAEPHLSSGDRGRWLRRLNEEQDNIRAALRWSLAQDDPELGLRLVGALWLWFLRRLLVEGRRWGEDLLAHPGAQQPTLARASVLFAAGHFAWLQGDVRTMRVRMDEAVAIRRRLHDAAGLGRALPFLGLALGDDHASARRLAEEGVACCRQVGDAWGLALALTNLGRIEATWGHDDAAQPSLEEATALFRSLGDGWLLALPLTSLGAIAYRAGNYEAASAAFTEALPCFRAVEDRRNTTQVLTNLGYTALARGEIESALKIFSESLAFGREHGDRFNTPACLRGFGATAAAAGEPVRAVRLLAAADALSVATGAARWPAERLGGPVATDDLRLSLGEDAFAAAWAAGQQLPPEQASAEALAAQSHAAH